MDLTISVYEDVIVAERVTIVRLFQGFQMPMSRPKGDIKYQYAGGSVVRPVGIINGGGL